MLHVRGAMTNAYCSNLKEKPAFPVSHLVPSANILIGTCSIERLKGTQNSVSLYKWWKYLLLPSVFVLRKVRISTIPELSLCKVRTLTLSGGAGIINFLKMIPELLLRKVGIGTK